MADVLNMLIYANINLNIHPVVRRQILPRKQPYVEYDERKFKERFRLSKTTVSKLLEQVRTNLLESNSRWLHG